MLTNSDLGRPTGLHHSVVDVKHLPGVLVRFHGVLEDFPQKGVIMGQLKRQLCDDTAKKA